MGGCPARGLGLEEEESGGVGSRDSGAWSGGWVVWKCTGGGRLAGFCCQGRGGSGADPGGGLGGLGISCSCGCRRCVPYLDIFLFFFFERSHESAAALQKDPAF